MLNPVWDTVPTIESAKHFYPRASHKSIVVGDEVWIHGGLAFNSDRISSDFVIYNVLERRFRTVKSRNEGPESRYDHSLVFHKVEHFNVCQYFCLFF